MMRRALVGIGDPLALAVSHRRSVITLDICRGVMSVGHVLLVVDAVIKRFFLRSLPEAYDDDESLVHAS